MTGYGDASLKRDGISVQVEIRSINNRYLKVSQRCTEPLGVLEAQIEEEIRKFVARGSVSVNICVVREASAERYRLNTALLSEFVRQLAQWSEREGLGADSVPRVGELLALPGVVQDQCAESDDERCHALIRETLTVALENLVKMRKREGAQLADDLRSHLRDVAGHLEHVIARAPEISRIFAERLVERLHRLLDQEGVSIEQKDVIREVAIFADKCDISEEISRLKSHFAQFETILASDPAPGKKLDFLTQELNREVNTIGSKANDFEVAQRVIAMKASVERIREQVQNIE